MTHKHKIKRAPAPKPVPVPAPAAKSLLKNAGPIKFNRDKPVLHSKIPDKAISYRKGKQSYGGNRTAQFEYNDLMPWERQPDESPESYLQFCVYRDADPTIRGYKVVADTLHMSRSVVTLHGAAYNWVERAAAWDFYLERARLAVTETYQIEMAMRHATLAKSMLDKLSERMKKVNLATLGPKEIAQWLDVGVKVERLSRGLNSDSGSNGASVVINNNMNAMSDQELLTALAQEGIRRGNTEKRVLNAAPQI